MTAPRAGTSLALVAAYAAGGCGDSTTPTTPEPVPICCPGPFFPPQHGVEGVAQIVSEPSDPDGYVTGEKIIVIFDSEEPLSTSDSPWLEIEIGEHVRLARFRSAPEDNWHPERISRRWPFEYTVTGDDLDMDGISISSEAFGLTYTGADSIRKVDGVRVRVTVTAVVSSDASGGRVEVQPGENVFSHRVTRPREPRVCTDERAFATNYSGFVREWDGTPFRVHMVRNFPDSVTGHARQALDLLGQLAGKIEDQTGYPIIEMGAPVEVPAGVRPDWDQVRPKSWRTCPLSRDPGQILLYHRNDVVAPGDSGPLSSEAVPPCGAIALYLPKLATSGIGDRLILRALFSLLGFWDQQGSLPDLDRVVWMSDSLARGAESGLDLVLWVDIDALRCIFPEAG